MNIQGIWSGSDYAWFEWKGRNEPFRQGAPRVKAIRVYKKREYGKTRETGYVEVMMLNEDGVPRERSDGSQIIREVRARDIAMLWDSYIEERDYRAAQAEKIAAERAEREAKETHMTMRLTELITEKYGIPQEAIYNVTPSGIHLSRIVLEKELGLESNGSQ